MATPHAKFIEGAMDEWWRESDKINILLTGKTGVGKSSLVNAILGQNVAVVGKSLNPQTLCVDSFEEEMDGIRVKIWDSPGLQDGLDNEEAYLEDIEKKCKGKVDLFLYCISMDSSRFNEGSRDIIAMCKLTEKLGAEIWNNAVFILTLANKFIRQKKAYAADNKDGILKIFQDRVKEWESKLEECLRDIVKVSPEIAKAVPVIPAGKKGLPILLKELTPWLSNLWMKSLLATRYSAQPALIKMNLQRLKFASDIHSDEEFQELLKKECIIIQDRACEIGKLIKADQEARAVGALSGKRAMIAHILERIFENPLIKIKSTSIHLDEDGEFLAAKMRLEIPAFCMQFPL